MKQDPSLSLLLHALADPTRRVIYERISASGEITVVDLTAGSSVTQGAVSQHLKTLKGAGLVDTRPEGRRVFYRATPQGLAPLAGWFDHYGPFWSSRFAELRTLLQQLDPKEIPDE